MAINRIFRPKKSSENALGLKAFKDKFFKERAERKGKPYDIHEAVVTGVNKYAKESDHYVEDRGLRSSAFDTYGYLDYLPALKPRIEALLRERGHADIPVRILDVGCGVGEALAQLKNMYGKRLEVHGCSLPETESKKRILLRAKKAGVRIAHAEASLLPYEKNKFDIVLSEHAFMYYPDKLKALREMMRVAKEGGTVMMHHLAPVSYGMRGFVHDEHDEPIDIRAELRKVGINARHGLSANSSHHALCLQKSKGDEERMRELPFEFIGTLGDKSMYRRNQPLRIGAP